LALVHETLKIVLPLEIDKHWKSQNELPKDVILDIDNLQALCILIVWWSRFSGLLVECFLIGEFVSKLTKDTTKMLYLDVLKASIDFFLEMEFHESCQDPESHPKSSESNLLSFEKSVDEGSQVMQKLK
jgi:hypothetical protein